jgi:hypothetical protein
MKGKFRKRVTFLPAFKDPALINRTLSGDILVRYCRRSSAIATVHRLGLNVDEFELYSMRLKTHWILHIRKAGAIRLNLKQHEDL